MQLRKQISKASEATSKAFTQWPMPRSRSRSRSSSSTRSRAAWGKKNHKVIPDMHASAKAHALEEEILRQRIIEFTQGSSDVALAA